MSSDLLFLSRTRYRQTHWHADTLSLMQQEGTKHAHSHFHSSEEILKYIPKEIFQSYSTIFNIKKGTGHFWFMKH